MKNKKINYILLPAVVLVWGYVIYQIFHSGQSNDNLITTGEIIQMPTENQKFDTFNIVADYRDPFLGKTIDPNPVVKTAVKAAAKPQTPPQQVEWPKIAYGGMIKNKKDDKQLAIVQVDGKENILKQGEEMSGIRLIKIYKDSIEIAFAKEKKVVSKN